MLELSGVRVINLLPICDAGERPIARESDRVMFPDEPKLNGDGSRSSKYLTRGERENR